MTMRPVIGITAYAEEAAWGVWNVPAALAPLAYVDEGRGGRRQAELLVPPCEDAIDETLDALDGLVFTGGPDLDPALYDAEPHPETNNIRPERDRAEIALLAPGRSSTNAGAGHLPRLAGAERGARW